ncbi:DgyrCDS6282 [Dimorphilus gyrociliatus]|uniref:DgyrCDS6282 n=1 Tax=Dimorphilus gyrociliatus TaxID=2664684 RepID=A0A7I8VMK4_9ANNE|nr:DgyrCDS6282 [Dimorphilus gyrociliatus]
MRRSIIDSNTNDQIAIKGFISAEVGALRKEIANLTGRFLSLESIYRATTEELYSVELTIKMYKQEMEFLELEEENILSHKENLIAENHGLLALLKICNEDLSDREEKKQQKTSTTFSTAIANEIDKRIAQHLPEDTTIFSNITGQILKKDQFRKRNIKSKTSERGSKILSPMASSANSYRRKAYQDIYLF